jgi:uncharacterized protein (TIGR03435 family)
MLADHLWQSTLVATLLGLLALTLRPNGARYRYRVWLCASLKFLVPFSWLVALGRQVAVLVAPAASGAPALPVPARAVEWAAPLVERVAHPLAGLSPRTPLVPTITTAATTVTHVDLTTAALLVWALGTAVVLGIWLVRSIRLWALVRRSHLLVHPLIDDLGIEARVSRSRLEPGVVGIWRPVLLLPDGITGRLKPAQLSAIVAHEACHVRRRDNLTAAAHMLVEALFWFHPLVWWIGARLVDERERACDEAVLETTNDPRSYADAIVAVCEFCVRSPLACAAGVGGAGTLRARVERLVQAPTVRALGAARRCSLVAAAAALLGTPVMIGILISPPARAQDAPPDAGAAAHEGAEHVRLDGDPPGTWIMGPRVTVIDKPLRDLIAMAFQLQKAQIVGPDSIDSRHYTIVGELPVVDYSRQPDPGEQFRSYVRSLLEERFGLVVHREKAFAPVLSLAGGASQPSLVEVELPDCTSICSFPRWIGRAPPPGCTPSIGCFEPPHQPNVIMGQNATIDMLTHFLSDFFGLPVLDQTNLTGRYDFEIEWPLESAQADRQGLPSNEVLKKLLDEQLGLRLLPSNAPVERLVVDRVAEPSNSPQSSLTAGVDPPAIILRDPVDSITGGAALELVLDRHGAMYLRHGNDLDPVPEPQSVVAIAADALSRDRNLAAFVSADGLIANHRVVEVANLLAAAGVTRIVFATLP